MHPTLDLHGEFADDARRRAEQWLRARAADGVRVAVVVTGRGRHSTGPPVLPGEIRDLLESLRGTVVSDWRLEPSGGAFRVELRMLRRSTPRRASVPLPAHTPEIRRRAEQSLEELGVQVTPVLLAAEIRRLLGED